MSSSSSKIFRKIPISGKSKELLPEFPLKILKDNLFEYVDWFTANELAKHPQFSDIPEYKEAKNNARKTVLALELLLKIFGDKYSESRGIYLGHYLEEGVVCKEDDEEYGPLRPMGKIKFIFEVEGVPGSRTTLFENNKIYQFLKDDLKIVFKCLRHTSLLTSKHLYDDYAFSMDDPLIISQATDKIFKFLQASFRDSEKKIKLHFINLFLYVTSWGRIEPTEYMTEIATNEAVDRKYTEVCRDIQVKKEGNIYRDFFNLSLHIEALTFSVRLDQPIEFANLPEMKLSM